MPRDRAPACTLRSSACQAFDPPGTPFWPGFGTRCTGLRADTGYTKRGVWDQKNLECTNYAFGVFGVLDKNECQSVCLVSMVFFQMIWYHWYHWYQGCCHGSDKLIRRNVVLSKELWDALALGAAQIGITRAQLIRNALTFRVQGILVQKAPAPPREVWLNPLDGPVRIPEGVVVAPKPAAREPEPEDAAPQPEPIQPYWFENAEEPGWCEHGSQIAELKAGREVCESCQRGARMSEPAPDGETIQ